MLRRQSAVATALLGISPTQALASYRDGGAKSAPQARGRHEPLVRVAILLLLVLLSCGRSEPPRAGAHHAALGALPSVASCVRTDVSSDLWHVLFDLFIFSLTHQRFGRQQRARD